MTKLDNMFGKRVGTLKKVELHDQYFQKYTYIRLMYITTEGIIGITFRVRHHYELWAQSAPATHGTSAGIASHLLITTLQLVGAHLPPSCLQ